MEFLETVSLFSGWDHGVFHGAADDCLGGGSAVLPVGLCHDYFHYCAEADFRRPCVRLAVPGVYYAVPQRRSVLLYRDFRAVSGKDLYGGQEASDLPGEGGTVNLNSFLTAKNIHVFVGI